MFERFNGNVVPFADESTSTNRTVFGSETQSDDIDDNLNADFKKGWEIVGLNDNPTREDFNAMGYTLGYLTSYLYQNGVAEYNLLQEYKTNSIAIGTDGNIYQSLVDNNLGNALTDTTKWVCIASKNSIVNSIAELKTISNIESINVLGYYEKGDGGGGTFYWDATSTETDNGGTIIQATGVTTGRWKRVFSGAVNVKWFGAKGDKVTDDAASIQAAMNSGNKKIFFPAGTYKIQTTIKLPYSGSYVIEGVGTGSIIKADATTPSIDLFDTNGNNGPLKTIRELNFNGPSIGVYGGSAIVLNGNGLHIDNCWFAGIGKGVEVIGTYCNISNSTFEYCFYGIDDTSFIENVYINNVGYKNETDIYIHPSTGGKASFINGFSAIATKTRVINLIGVVGGLISNITAENDGTTHTPQIVRIGGTSYGNIISNISTKGFGSYLVFLEGSNVDNNLFSNLYADNITYGIFISTGNRNRFANARFLSCTNGVRIDTASSNHFTGIITDSCGYGFYVVASTNCRFVECDTVNSTTFGMYAPSTTTVYTNGCIFDSKSIPGTEKAIAYP